MSRLVVGIDLGTTFSLVSVLQDGRPIVLPNALGEGLTASAVSIDDEGAVLVGAPARARAVTHPERTQLAFKRDMGTDRTYTLGGKRFTPVELSALVLGALKADAERALGTTIAEAVVTVPAYFGERQRQATRDAARIAGLEVPRIVNEPTAAALAYGLHERSRDAKIAVLDLGGGTFDVTLLEIIDGVIEVQASAGDARLGGEDFVDVIVAHVEKSVGAAIDPKMSGRVREAAELAKRRLSTTDATRIVLPGLMLASGSAIDLDVPFDRTTFEKLGAPLLDRMRVLVMRALADAQRRPEDVDEVLLVGGATRMPAMAHLAATAFGRLPLRALPPDEAVALGAAVQAALVAQHAAVDDLVVTDVAPFTLGIETSSHAGSGYVAGLFTPILERGTTIPASRSKSFFTIADRQTEIDVRIYQGEHSLCRDNTKLAELRVSGLRPLPAGEQGIDVRFTYDPSGLLEVDVEVRGTGKRDHLLVEDRPGKLGKADIERVRANMSKLKFHPSESLPNRTATMRAEALYTQLTGRDREFLGMALTQFRAALETQDATLITQSRERLVAIVAALTKGA